MPLWRMRDVLLKICKKLELLLAFCLYLISFCKEDISSMVQWLKTLNSFYFLARNWIFAI